MDWDREHVIQHYPSQTGPLVRNNNYKHCCDFSLKTSLSRDPTRHAWDAFRLSAVVKSGYRAERFTEQGCSALTSLINSHFSLVSCPLARGLFPCERVLKVWNPTSTVSEILQSGTKNHTSVSSFILLNHRNNESDTRYPTNLGQV